MTRASHVAVLLAGLALGACQSPPLDRGPCEDMLQEQARQWNRGDLPGFVSAYWPGQRLTFLGSGGLTRGQQDLLARYQKNYPTAKERGQLTFTVIDFQPLGPDHALLLGRYELDRDQPDAGFFSLVLARDGQTVRILHDHTSRATKPD
ncbi:MAG: hypothetical protein VYE77_04380 [Planctomycetota bacterium]|nr:hypothetical protein [Planctomycetota bacterium]